METIFAGTYFGGGVFRSSDNGGTWSEQEQWPGRNRRADDRGQWTNDDIFAGTYGIGMFRSTDTAEVGRRLTTVWLRLYVRSLAINSRGDIFAGADFINGAGGVFRSTDNGENWIEVNQGVITTDVRALAINSNGDIFAGTYFGGGVFRSTDNGLSWTPVDNGLTCTNIWSLAINPDGDIFAGSAGCGEGVFRSTDNGDHWTLVNNGLTSTDIAALAINEKGYIFAGTFSQFGVGGGSSDRSTTAIPGRNKIMALPRSMLTRGHQFCRRHFCRRRGWSFSSRNNGNDWRDISSGMIPVGGNVLDNGDRHDRILRLQEPLVAESSAALKATTGVCPSPAHLLEK